ncbi:ABC transporter ATP-binding protein/permease [Mycobacterium sp. MYCO198283]|uniref:ABC transporter ATP-binding protein n=1 Tax=Mycobacterium sp. MYCO198283 TaxID=2883505 RepID=UPI001E359637|nr:ABC transporter ATP-binding protein [Mycobacterium sp. MYCO198283]MCG5433992.1 ABC transporter ATP-binding protein/permease [Mycobacterium sp. MYCO198283]
MIRTLRALMPRGQRVGRFVALAVASVILRAVATVLLVPLVAALFSGAPGDALGWLGWLTAATAAGWAVDWCVSRLGFELGFALLARAQHDVADRLPGIALTWFTAERTATARQAIAATGPEVVGLVVNLLTPLLGAVLLPAAIGVALLFVSWPLGLAALTGVVVLGGALWAGGRLTRAADQVAAQTNSAFTERLIEFARTQQALRAARRVEPARSAVGEALAAQHGATLRLLRLQVPGQMLFALAGQLALILLAGVITAQTVSGSLGVAEAVAFIVVTVRYLEPFTTVAELSPAIESARATLDRISAVLAAPSTPAGTASLPSGAPPRIAFEDVTFRYGQDGPPVLDAVSVVLEPGTTTAIVGPSGSGKSTILGLIAGLHEPTGGRVLVDGVDTASLTADARRGLAAVVFQHPYLFAGSIADNIRAGDPDASAEQIAAVMRLARVDELVERLPDGAATAVGEAGAALAGGERQRISIARALLKPAPILLVDEATSALDNENERAIVDALTADVRPRTRIIVAHRLASIARADRVLFVDGGRIVEDGTIGELRSAGGRFSEFWQQQHDAARWRVGGYRSGSS